MVSRLTLASEDKISKSEVASDYFMMPSHLDLESNIPSDISQDMRIDVAQPSIKDDEIRETPRDSNGGIEKPELNNTV